MSDFAGLPRIERDSNQELVLTLQRQGSSAGTVTSLSIVTANGISGSVANPTTTPAVTLTLGAITPTTIVASGAISGSNLSGTNTGDQTTLAITNDTTTNALMYPIWVTTTSGNLPLKISSTKFGWNPSIPALIIGSTGVTPFGQFELNETRNGSTNASIKNLSNGTDATASFMLWNDVSKRLDFVMTSSTYISTSNGISTNDRIIVAAGSSGGNFLFGTEVATPLIFITGGNTTAHRRMTIDDNGIFTFTSPLPNSTSTGFTFTTTTTGSTGNRTGINNILSSGYTGSGLTFALRNVNSVAGTGTDPWTTGACNAGLLNIASGVTTGTNIGAYNQCYGGDLAYASFNYAYDDAKANSTHIAVAGFSTNTGSSGKQIAGYFGLQATTPTFTSAALMCDNGATTSSIFVARDNGTAVFTIADGGNITATGSITAASFSGNASSATTATTAGSLTGSQDWTDYSSTSTIVGWSSFTVKVLEYKLLDAHTMLVHFKLAGTSDATSVSFTLPVTSNSSTGTANQMVYCTDNGTDDFGLVSLPNNSSTVTVYYHTGLTNWTALGTKLVSSDCLVVHY